MTHPTHTDDDTATQEEPQHPCPWTLEDEDADAWATGCGELFVITCSTPAQHGMRFCCYCGGALVEVPNE